MQTNGITIANIAPWTKAGFDHFQPGGEILRYRLALCWHRRPVIECLECGGQLASDLLVSFAIQAATLAARQRNACLPTPICSLADAALTVRPFCHDQISL